MCGIAGIVSFDGRHASPSLEHLAGMIGSLRHRGPDEFGVYRDGRAGLAHARLSIIDLASGQQPLSNEDGTLWVVFNGEIFNYLELREELEARGHRFKTRSDTEVIVHAYEQWGDQAFRRFNGQWAVALWNSQTGTLILARDPFGVRPLYVARRGERLVFASEIKAIFVGDPDLPRQFDPAGLDELSTFWAPVAPRTVFAGIEEIPPAEVRTYSVGRLVRTRSWDPGYPGGHTEGFSGSLDEAVEAVRGALQSATALRMLRADVPVGSYLSGGLDSSFIAALALRATGKNFSTFSLRFEDAEYDETPYQRVMAAHLGSEHHEITVRREDIARVFPEVIYHTERPILRTAPAPLFLLSKSVRDAGIKVVLTGEGADEMFAGYDLFREAKVRRFWARQPHSLVRPRLLERLYPYMHRSPVAQRAVMQQFFGRGLEGAHGAGFGHETRWRGTAALKRLMMPEMRATPSDPVATLLKDLPAGFPAWSPLAQDQYLEIRTLLSGYLLSSQGDRMLMAHSVEGRFPFLDREVAALAEALPPEFKLRVLNEKYILKRAAVGLVPPSVLSRQKQPYRAPDALSFANPSADWIEAVTSTASLSAAGVFNPAAARQLIAKCRSCPPNGQFSNSDNMAVVAVLSTQLVYEHFIRQRPQAAPPARIRTVIDRVGAAVRTV